VTYNGHTGHSTVPQETCHSTGIKFHSVYVMCKELFRNLGEGEDQGDL